MKFSSIYYHLRSPAEHGLSLVEVLVSILMIAAFLATAMQALLSATAIKVRSEEISEATTWMQEDLEAIRFEANQLGFNAGTDTYEIPLALSNVTLTDCDPADPDFGFAEELRDELISGPEDYKYANATEQPVKSSIGDRPYSIRRQLTPDENTLEVEHIVFEEGGNPGDPIAKQYSEVMPDVAFACP